MTLDDKLKEMLSNYGCPDSYLDNEVAKLKQVFADEHYVQIKGEQYTDGQIIPTYSGQEWYELFRDEFVSTTTIAQTSRDSVLDAAERASGIKDQK